VDVGTRPKALGSEVMNGSDFILLNPNLYWVMAIGLAMYIVLKWK